MPNLTIEHQETGEVKVLTDVEFRNFMRKEGVGSPWQVTASEVSNTDGIQMEAMSKELSKVRKQLEQQKAVANSTMIEAICAILGVEWLNLPMKSDGSGGEVYAITPGTILNDAIDIRSYTKDFAAAIKVVLKQKKIAWEREYEDEFDDGDDEDYN